MKRWRCTVENKSAVYYGGRAMFTLFDIPAVICCGEGSFSFLSRPGDLPSIEVNDIRSCKENN